MYFFDHFSTKIIKENGQVPHLLEEGVSSGSASLRHLLGGPVVVDTVRGGPEGDVAQHEALLALSYAVLHGLVDGGGEHATVVVGILADTRVP